MTKQRIEPGCVFCLTNGLVRGGILAQSEHAFAIHPQGNDSAYLIVPVSHTETLQELSDDWWQHFKDVLERLDLPASYNLSLNYGEAAGQSVKHLHFWIIVRSDHDPAAGKGLARLLNETNQE